MESDSEDAKETQRPGVVRSEAISGKNGVKQQRRGRLSVRDGVVWREKEHVIYVLSYRIMWLDCATYALMCFYLRGIFQQGARCGLRV